MGTSKNSGSTKSASLRSKTPTLDRSRPSPLPNSEIGAAIVSCKAVQRHGLLDSGRIGRFVEQAAQLAGCSLASAGFKMVHRGVDP
jgi:hypothetical protein